MANAKNAGRGPAASQGTDGDGQAGVDPVGAEAVVAAPSEGGGQHSVVTGYSTVDAAAHAAEEAEGQHGRRIVKVLCSDEKLPELWYGNFGNAPVEAGENGFVFSDGETVTL